MLLSDYEGENLYLCALELFVRTGHTFVSGPIFYNHTPEQFFYIDNHFDGALSHIERGLFLSFNNVSFLFCNCDCAYYSINLAVNRDQRSQLAHDIHTLLHRVTSVPASVCLFRHEDEVLVSMVGYQYRCMLSDWYRMDDDYRRLEDRLHISNMSLENTKEFFSDLVFVLARHYYFLGFPSYYELLPIDFVSNRGPDVLKSDIDEVLEEEYSKLLMDYGDDFVEYQEKTSKERENIQKVLEIMLLSVDDEENPFEENSFESGENEKMGEQKDIYAYEDVDPEVFQKAELMVKWLNKHGDEKDE